MSPRRRGCVSTVPPGRFSIDEISRLDPRKKQRKGNNFPACQANCEHSRALTLRGFLNASSVGARRLRFPIDGPLRAWTLTYGDHFQNPASRPAASLGLPMKAASSEKPESQAATLSSARATPGCTWWEFFTLVAAVWPVREATAAKLV